MDLDGQPHLSGQGKSWFFGIGINEYQAFPKLYNAVKDVEDVSKLLLKKYDIHPECVLMLTDNDATREKIIDRLDWLISNIEPKDKLIIYYSGHGHLDKITERGYWIPYDAKKGKTSFYIRNSTIRDYIKDINSLHTLLLSDSCFSGTLFVRGSQRSATVMDELEMIPSRWAICSGRHNEEVYDGEPGKNSPFAESIIDVLNRNKKQALNIIKVADHIIEQTRANYTQLPEANPLHGVGHKGGQYVFRLKANEWEDWAKCKAEDSITVYQLFLEKYPDGEFVTEAKESVQFLEEEEAWKKAKEEHSIIAYFQYETQYPHGRYAKQALEAIRELEEEKTWNTTREQDTLYAYRSYIRKFPDGKFHGLAERRVKEVIEHQKVGKEEKSSPVLKKEEEGAREIETKPKNKPTRAYRNKFIAVLLSGLGWAVAMAMVKSDIPTIIIERAIKTDSLAVIIVVVAVMGAIVGAIGGGISLRLLKWQYPSISSENLLLSFLGWIFVWAVGWAIILANGDPEENWRLDLCAVILSIVMALVLISVVNIINERGGSMEVDEFLSGTALISIISWIISAVTCTIIFLALDLPLYHVSAGAAIGAVIGAAGGTGLWGTILKVQRREDFSAAFIPLAWSISWAIAIAVSLTIDNFAAWALSGAMAGLIGSANLFFLKRL